MGMDAHMGDIMVFPYNFAPRNWATCDGQLLPIAHNTALFSLLGTTYGGDGRTTFALPNLQGRLAMHQGSGPGLSDRSLGQQGGAETVGLGANQMTPLDRVRVPNVVASAVEPGPNAPPNEQDRAGPTHRTASGSAAPDAFESAPGKVPAHTNMMPTQVMTICICLEGAYPSRP